MLAAVAAVAMLTGCLPLPFTPPRPSPTEDRRVQVEAAEELMMETMPFDAGGFEVHEQTGLAEATFGSDWSEVDHDATRYARSFRSFESVGWADSSRGPAFWIDFEVVLMESGAAAETAVHEVALAAEKPYTIASEDGTAETTYAPMDPVSGRWPFGTVEQTRSVLWSSGARASGWATYYQVGPFVAVVYSAATPDAASQDAMNAFADEHFPAFIEAVQELPDALDRLERG